VFSKICTMNDRAPQRAFLAFVCSVLASVASDMVMAGQSVQATDGTVRVQAYSLPESSFLSSETRAALQAEREQQREGAAIDKSCPSAVGGSRDQLEAIRRCEREAFYATPLYKDMRSRYAVSVEFERDCRGVHGSIRSTSWRSTRQPEARSNQRSRWRIPAGFPHI